MLIYFSGSLKHYNVIVFSIFDNIVFLNFDKKFLYRVFPTDVPEITEVISAKDSSTDFHKNISQADQQITSQTSSHESPVHVTNYSNDERHVKFNLENELISEPKIVSNQNSTITDDVSITMQCE